MTQTIDDLIRLDRFDRKLAERVETLGEFGGPTVGVPGEEIEREVTSSLAKVCQEIGVGRGWALGAASASSAG